MSPNFVREELLSKDGKISEFSKLSEAEVQFAIDTMLEYVTLVPKYKYEDKINEAKDIAKNFDYKDYPFIALALKLDVPVWTGDKEMIRFGLKSGKYLAFDTEAVEDLVKGKSIEDVLEDLKKRYLSFEKE